MEPMNNMEPTSNSDEFVFLDSLPEQLYTPQLSRFERFADALKANPGQWSPWPTEIAALTARAYAERINTRRKPCPKALRRSGFEAVYRDGIVYVRYVEPGYNVPAVNTRLSRTDAFEVRTEGALNSDVPAAQVRAKATPDGTVVIVIDTDGNPVQLAVDGVTVFAREAQR